jgi:hypothetical protein
MFGNILGKKDSKNTKIDEENQDLIDKISKMNLTDMRLYVNNKMSGHESSEDGIIEVIKRLTTKNEETSKRYIEIDDMDSKIKKAFDLVILLSNHRKITVVAVELMQNFLELYDDVILKYDTENKQIYASKLKDAVKIAIENINKMSIIQKENSVLGNN